MGKSNKAPDYAATTTDTGLYGSTTTDKNETTFNPTDFQKSIVNNVENNVPNNLSNYFSANYANDDFQKYLNSRQSMQTNAYNNIIYDQLANKGMMRDNALSGAKNAWNSVLSDQKVDALSDYKGEQLSQLNTLMGLYEVPYNIMNGQSNASQGLSNAITQYNVNKYNSEFNKNQQLFNLASEIGTSAGGFGGNKSSKSGGGNTQITGSGRGGNYA